MLQIIQAIFQSPIARYCAFKGGTLAFFFHKLDRFSTNIDVDLLDPAQEMHVVQTLDEIFASFGTIKNMVKAKTLHRRIISYDQSSINIKVEVNKRIWIHNHYEIVSLYGVDCKVMSVTSLVTNKLIALYERMANRDLYDTWFFIKQGYSYDEALVYERTQINVQELMCNLIVRIPKHFLPNVILFQLGEVLSDSQKSRVKHQLVSTTVNLLQAYIDMHTSKN